MKININFVDECSKGEYGTCQITNRDTINIEISRALNQDQSQFFVTLLHELLHAWLFVMKANDIKISIGREHKWIYSVQAVVFEALKLLNKKAKYAKNTPRKK